MPTAYFNSKIRYGVSQFKICQQISVYSTRSRGYKTFFMLNSVQHESLNAHKYNNIKKFGFLDSDKSRMLFFPLINVKMPTTLGILIFMSRKEVHAQLS